MSVENLQRLADEVADPALRDWLTAGLERWRSGELLETALDLRRHDRRSRDELLRRAAALTLGGTHCARARLLHDEIQAFESRVWPRWKDLTSPPDNVSEMRQCLFRARRINGKPLPEYRQLLRIL